MHKFDSTKMSDVDRDDLFRLLDRHGVDPREVRCEGAVIRGDRDWHLHLSKFVRDDSGNLVIDHARGEAVTRPLVLNLGPDTPPRFIYPVADKWTWLSDPNGRFWASDGVI